MKITKRILAVLLAVIMIVCAVPFGASAKDYYAGDTIEFGKYPQSEVTLLSDVTAYLALNAKSVSWTTCGFACLRSGDGDVSSTDEKAIVSFADAEYDGNLYRGIKISELRPHSAITAANSKDYSYQDDNGFAAGKTYWFKYEPIKWIVANTNGLLISEDILDAQCFNNIVYIKNNNVWKDEAAKSFANIYNESDIRAFLTDSFCSAAFSEDEKACLSADFSNLNGSDLVSLASADFCKSYFGLAKPVSAKAGPTAYAKCLGIKVESGNSAYFLKDAGQNSAFSYIVNASGSSKNNADQVYIADGVRPVIKLKTLKNYTLSYDMNGGIGSAASQNAFGNADFTVTSTAPRKNGYDFLGWSTDAKATAAQYTAGDKITLKENTTLYAVWAAKSYTVSFNANGGSCSVPSKVVAYNSAYGTLPVPERSGYFFLGWFGSASSLDRTEITAETIFSSAANKTLYAHWSQARTVTYYGNGGEDEVTGVPAAQVNDVKYNAPSEIPQRKGYNFLGWAKAPGATKADYKPSDKIPGGLFGKLEDDLDLYAVWQMIDTTVEIREPSITTVKAGDSLVLHANIGGTVPAESEMVWTVDNAEIFDMNANGETCTITPKKSGDATFTFSIVDNDGDTLYSYIGPTELTASQKVTSKAGFFQKLAAFFKKIFKATKIYDLA